MPRQVFTGGTVFDGHRYVGGAAVAVEDGRIAAVGTVDEVRAAVGGGDAVAEVDLAGGLLAPAFRDAHLHPMIGGLERLRCDLSDLTTPADYVAAVAEYAAAHPDATWIRGGGWKVGAFPGPGPTAAELDAVVPDRPVFLPSSDHHDVWVNSKALEIAGVDASTPDPPDGWFVRDAAGRPSGTLREAAIGTVGRHVTTSREEDHAALREAQAFLFSHGIVGWQDALIGGYAGIDDPTQAYLDMLAAGELLADVRAAQWWDRHRGLEQVDDLLAQRDKLATAGLDAGSVKFMVDGIAETFTAAVTEPYVGDTGCPCGAHGLSFMTAEQLDAAVAAVDEAGFQAHFHAIGDRAVQLALDAVEHARRRNGPSDHRHHLAHLQLVRPEDRERFARLEVTANLQGMWAHTHTPAVAELLPYLDDERSGWHYPFADIVAAGARTAGGSDWPVNTPSPLEAIHVLVNRREPGGAEGDALVPEQALSLEQAFATYTSGSARVNHAPGGAIEVGAPADLVLLDRDPFAGPAAEIGEAGVVGTWLRGRRVYGG